MPVAEWVQKEAQGILPPGDYEVIVIADERKRGRSKEYLVKWKVVCYPSLYCQFGCL